MKCGYIGNQFFMFAKPLHFTDTDDTVDDVRKNGFWFKNVGILSIRKRVIG